MGVSRCKQTFDQGESREAFFEGKSESVEIYVIPDSLI